MSRISYLAFIRSNQNIFSDRGNLPWWVEKRKLNFFLEDFLRTGKPVTGSGDGRFVTWPSETCPKYSNRWKTTKNRWKENNFLFFYLESSKSHNVQNMKYARDILDENQPTLFLPRMLLSWTSSTLRWIQQLWTAFQKLSTQADDADFMPFFMHFFNCCGLPFLLREMTSISCFFHFCNWK